MNATDVRKTLGILVNLLLSFSTSFAQENFVSGHLIDTKNETSFGLVDFREWQKNPKKINFKSDLSADPITYTPSDIVEFSVENEVYVRAIIHTVLSNEHTVGDENAPKNNVRIDTVFLQTLISGEKSLFQYTTNRGTENFYIWTGIEFELLSNEPYTKQLGNDQPIPTNKKFVGQLNLYLKDCGDIYSKIEGVGYNQKSLIRLFQYYYKCAQSDIFFQRKVDKNKVEFGALTGFSVTSIEFRGDAIPFLTKARFNSSKNFSTGLYLDLIFPRNQGKWSLYNELQFTSYNFGEYHEESQNENVYQFTSTDIGYSYLKINNLLRLSYPFRDWTLIFNAGISNGFSIRETNHTKYESIFYTTMVMREGLALDDTRRYEQSYILGMGAKHKRFSAELRHERGNGMSNYVELVSATRRTYLLLGYRF